MVTLKAASWRPDCQAPGAPAFVHQRIKGRGACFIILSPSSRSGREQRREPEHVCVRDLHTRHKDKGEQDRQGAGHTELGRQVDAERDRAGWRKQAGEGERQRNSLGGMGDGQEKQEKGKRHPQSRETEAERRKQRAEEALNRVDFSSFLPSFSPPAASPLNLSLPSPVSSHVLLYVICPISLIGHLSLTVCLSPPSLLPPTPNCGVSRARLGRGSAAGRYQLPPSTQGRCRNQGPPPCSSPQVSKPHPSVS